NPYAVSHADALGLMQVVQHSAGKDVFRSQGKSGTPSRNFLFDQENSDYKMCNHTTRIPLNGSPVNAQNSHQCHICELYGKSFVQ
ncbi:transglycosylase SLT domain-containing protein, partial [Salmonella enterica subsp. enterica serovar Anatum]|nr:transglycosylase SLT domain-containing protein [Salmonella enterica subsp. enterica serovar Anatum]